MKAMKKVMIVTIAMVILLGISDKALADVWRRCGLVSSGRFQPGGRQFLGRSFGRIAVGRGLRTNVFRAGGIWPRCGLSSSGRNVYYGRDRSTLGKVLRYVRPGMNIVGGLHQMSVDNRLVDHQISVDNRMISMAERDQRIRAQRGTVLMQRGPIILQVTKPEQMQTQENEEFRKEVEALKLKLEAIKLQQELQKLEKQAKK